MVAGWIDMIKKLLSPLPKRDREQLEAFKKATTTLEGAIGRHLESMQQGMRSNERPDPRP